MKRLTLLRHGKAEAEPSFGTRDFDRALTARGIDDVRESGRYLASLALPTPAILCSSSQRTRETLCHLLAFLDPACQTALYLGALFHSSADQILEQVSLHGGEAEHVLIVGHNPGFELLADRLAGELCGLPTAGLASFLLETDSWEQAGRAPVRARRVFFPGQGVVFK